MANYYTPSNGFSPMSFLFFILTSLIIIPILSFIYSYAIWYIPFPYINFFITAGFGFIIGIIITYLVVNLGKVRNPMLAGVFGFLGAFVGLYFSWAVWVSLAMESPSTLDSSLGLASQPMLLFNIIGTLMEVGVWGLFDSIVSGIPLLIVWIIEALIVIVLGVISPLGKSREPFCEVNNKWFVEKALPAFNVINNPQDCVNAIEAKDIEFFKMLGRSENPGGDHHSQFLLYSNETNENFLSVSNQIKSINDNGEIEFDEKEIIRYVEISEEMSNFLEG